MKKYIGAMFPIVGEAKALVKSYNVSNITVSYNLIQNASL